MDDPGVSTPPLCPDGEQGKRGGGRHYDRRVDEMPTPTPTGACSSVSATASTWGIDLAAPTALLAQRGFEGLVCNDVADLGQWRLNEGAVALHLADGALIALLELERVAHGPIVVGVAVPGWVGSLQRHDLAERLAAREPSVGVTCVSSTTCLAIGSNRAAVRSGSAPADETVLAVDADLGWSAGLVRISNVEVVEVACAAAMPGTAVDRDGLLGSLLSASSASPDVVPVDRVVVIGPPGEEVLVAAALDRILDAPRPPIEVVATRRTTAAGALVIGSPAADRDAGGSLLSGRTSGAGEPWRLVPSVVDASASPRAAGCDEIAVILCEPTMPTCAGQHHDADVAAAVVAVASASVTVATAGLLATAAADHLSDGDGLDGLDGLDGPMPDDATGPAGSPGDDGVGAPPGLAEALVRCERLLSYEVGAPVAVRSVPALVGCDDHAQVDELVSAAAGLRTVAEHRGDELGGALLDAIDVGLACIAADAGHRYAAGTIGDVTAEVERVVEHLWVVVGVVAPAERARIVRDVALLGLDPSSAAELVAEVSGPEPAGLGMRANGRAVTGHRNGVAVWRPSEGRFVLADAVPQGAVWIRVLVER